MINYRNFSSNSSIGKCGFKSLLEGSIPLSKSNACMHMCWVDLVLYFQSRIRLIPSLKSININWCLFKSLKIRISCGRIFVHS